MLRVGLRLLLQQQQAEHILRFSCLNLSEQRSKVIHHKCYKQLKDGQMNHGLVSDRLACTSSKNKKA